MPNPNTQHPTPNAHPGYHGRALVVDVTTGAAREEVLPVAWLRRVIGGVGLGAWLLSEHAPAGCDPRGPDNALVLAASPLLGTGLTTATKYALVTKSPQTGFITDSLSSSDFAHRLKDCGYDAIVIVGRAPAWSVLCIEAGSVWLERAETLLNLSAGETDAALRGEGRREWRVAAVGLAGETGSALATVSNDGRHAGRGGVGCVLGAKRIKAIALAPGRCRVTAARPEALEAARRELAARSLGPATAKYRQMGTTANLLTLDRLGALPTRNFGATQFEGAERLSGEALLQGRVAQRTGCAHCTISCERRFPDASGRRQRLEYETQFALGPLLGIDDPDAVLAAARLCDEYGMDSISVGGTLAWAMETVRRGLLSADEADGLCFGAVDAVPGAIEGMARRTGIGALLADGSRAAARRLGGGSEAWSMQVKGLELPGYEPRSLKTAALGLAVAARGACHNRSSAYDADLSGRVDRFGPGEERGRVVAEAEDFAAILDSLVLCKFLRGCFTDFYTEAAALLAAVTGWDVTGEELRRTGERITTVKKRFNLREGWTRADDSLPTALLDHPVPDGPAAGLTLAAGELDRLVASYYVARGWTPHGQVPAEKLNELDLLD
jgi:aldehyde:ferredoxin oxidoreductase